MRIKRSFGIICVKDIPSRELEFLMIKRAATYYFAEFVAGHYSAYTDRTLIRLLNSMTYDEKLSLMTLNFDNLWYKLYGAQPSSATMQPAVFSSYLKKKAKFERSFLRDRGQHLIALIKNSTINETPIEFPKGRADQHESKVAAAVRELHEETGLTRDKYKILWHLAPYTECFDDYGCRYHITYYFARLTDLQFSPTTRFFARGNFSEASYSAFMSGTAIQASICRASTKRRLLKCFDKLGKKYRAGRAAYIH